MDFELTARPREWQLTRDFGRGAGPRKTGAERSPEPVRGEDRRAVPGVGRRKALAVQLGEDPGRCSQCGWRWSPQQAVCGGEARRGEA